MSVTAHKQTVDKSQGKNAASVNVRRLDAAEQVLKIAASTKPAEADEEGCPVIRANKIVFAPAGGGRTRIVFF
ncbi:MAG: hypothetical protein QM775_01175 [Pirellulales bacterium]